MSGLIDRFNDLVGEFFIWDSEPEKLCHEVMQAHLKVLQALEEAWAALETAVERYDCAGLTDLPEFKEIEAAQKQVEAVLKETR